MSFGKFSDAAKDKSTEGAKSSASSVKDPEVKTTGGTKALLGQGSKVAGNLSFDGPAELGGEVEGEICAKCELVIAEGAVIKAKVIGTDVLVRGSVTGDIIVSGKLALEKPAKVHGNISCPTLRIEDGVVFEGSCSMKGTPGAG